MNNNWNQDTNWVTPAVIIDAAIIVAALAFLLGMTL